MKKDDDIFNPAFQNLQSKIKDSQKAAQESKTNPPQIVEPEEDDNKFFHEAMSNVAPLPDNRGKITKNPGPSIKPSHPAPDDEQKAIAHLNDLVKGSIEMDITFSDEYMEGSVKGFGPKLMRQLKKGRFPVQDYIDLHGFTRQEAETKVKNFLLQSRRQGFRCVLIVHGRGLNSPDSFPVLKDRLPIWLNRGPVKKIVLAFATARPYDGGPGAIYVLLRKR